MKVILFGATGMVGQGVLRECLADDEVESVLIIGRKACGVEHSKVHDLVHADLYDYGSIADQLSGYDACFFCLGVSAAGLSEEKYRRITFDLTAAAARVLLERNPGMTFVYVSGAGTDSTERGRIMWARVKGKTENHLLGLGFKAAYMFRPGYIQPLHGIKSSTKLYRAMYTVVGPFYPLFKRVVPTHVTTTESVGRAMLAVVRRGYDSSHLDNRDINRLAGVA